MLDGFKILIKDIPPVAWIKHPKLDFIGKHNVETGEIIESTWTAKYNGFTFEIFPTDNIEKPSTMQIKGSIHTFYNNGIDNSTVFTYSEMIKAIQQLKNEFGVKPETAIFKRLEFGINMYLNTSPDSIISCFIAHKEAPFLKLKNGRKVIGSTASRLETDIKVYNKSKQLGIKNQNIMRIEVSFKKMRQLKPFEIETLHDLQQLKKIQALQSKLIETIDEVLFYDNSISFALLTTGQRTQIANYRNPNWWAELVKRKRYKHRKKFSLILDKYPPKYGKETFVKSFKTALQNTVDIKLLGGDHFTDIENNIQRNKGATISPFNCGVKRSPLKDINTIPKTARTYTNKNKVELSKNQLQKEPSTICAKIGHRTIQKTFYVEQKRCLNCGRDISNQRKDSKTCSDSKHGANGKRCRNAVNYLTRKFKNMINTNIIQSVVIHYKQLDQTYTVELEPSEIIAAPKWVINQVTRVDIYTKQNALIGYREYKARQFIAEISQINERKQLSKQIDKKF